MGLILHWDCFIEGLSSSPGGAIPLGAVLDYCRFYGIEDVELREDMLAVSRFLSTEYLGMVKSNKEQSAALAKRLADRAPGRHRRRRGR